MKIVKFSYKFWPGLYFSEIVNFSKIAFFFKISKILKIEISRNKLRITILIVPTPTNVVTLG